MIMELCVICKAGSIKHFKTIEVLPAIIFPVCKEDRDVIESKSISTSYCPTCEHIFQTDIDQDFLKKIYSEWYSYYPHSNLELLNDAHRRPFEELWQSLDIHKKKTLLEIGTSEPTHLEPFLKIGINCNAINPGAQSHAKIRFIDAYYENYDFEEKFDVIVARFLFEHVVNLQVFIEKIKNDLAEEGILLIQVPDTFAMLRDGTLNFLAHEHTNYFTRKSIAALFMKNGFQILQTNNISDASIIIAFTIKDVKNKDYEYQIQTGDLKLQRFLENNTQVKESIEEKFKDCEDIVFYGAGMSLTELLYNSKSSEHYRNNASIVDDNVLVQEKFMPRTMKPITRVVDSATIGKSRILLTCRKIYEESIFRRLKSYIPLRQIFVIRENSIISLQNLEKYE